MVEATRDGVTAKVSSGLSEWIFGVTPDLAWEVALVVVDALVAFQWSDGEHLAEVQNLLGRWDGR